MPEWLFDDLPRVVLRAAVCSDCSHLPPKIPFHHFPPAFSPLHGQRKMGKLADPGGAEAFQRGEEEESVFQLWTGSAWERLSEPEQAFNQTPAADSDVTARHVGLFSARRGAFSVHCRSFIICSRKTLP